jgi:FkbM family methyltransferase
MRTKVFEFGEHGIHYRPGTSDAIIIESVLIHNHEYNLPDIPVKRAVDVGANIGVTAIKMALKWPEAKIFCYEPEPGNFALLEKNTAPYPNILIFQKALGDKSEPAPLFQSSDKTNFGGHSMFPDYGVVNSFQLVEKIQARHAPGLASAPCDFMKIDCEGAEGMILGDLAEAGILPPWIMGELHGYGDFDLLRLLAGTHELAVSKTIGQRCFPFLAVEKSIVEAVLTTGVSTPE